MDSETATKIIHHFEGLNGVKNHVWSHDMERVKIPSHCDIPQIAFSPKDIISNKSLLDVFLNEKVLDDFRFQNMVLRVPSLCDKAPNKI